MQVLDLIEKIDMNNYIGIGVLIIVIIISYLIAKNGFKNWYKLDSVSKSLIIRLIIVLVAGIILLIYQNTKSH